MNWYSLFYWLTVAENAKTFFVVCIVIFTVISAFYTLGYLMTLESRKRGSEDLEFNNLAGKWIKWSYPFAILFWTLYIFTPDRKDALFIIAGGGTLQFLTTDSTSRQIPHELSNFVLTQLKEMSDEAHLQVDITSKKEEIIKKAKTMTSDELMNQMKSDSNFAKIILEKK